MPVPSVAVATLYFEYKANGWSERYHLPETTYTDALPQATLLAKYRRSFLGSGAQITFGRVSFTGNPREGKAFLEGPLDAHAKTEQEPEDVWTGLMYRLETAGGPPPQRSRWANRILRAVPDAMIFHQALVAPPPSPLAAGAPLPGPDGTVVATMQRAFLTFLLRHTKMAVKITAGENAGQYDLLDWDRIVFRKVAKRDTGRPFGLSRGRAPKR